MPAVENLEAIKSNLVFNNGTTQSGSVIKLNVSLGTLEPTRWNADKALNIMAAAAAVYSQTLMQGSSIKTYRITQGS